MLFLLRRRTLKENIMQRQKWIVGLLIVSSVAMVSGCSWMFSLFAKAPMDVLY